MVAHRHISVLADASLHLLIIAPHYRLEAGMSRCFRGYFKMPSAFTGCFFFFAVYKRPYESDRWFNISQIACSFTVCLLVMLNGLAQRNS